MFGDPFDDGTLAVTLTWSSRGVATESDVVFNTKYGWNAYRGTLRREADTVESAGIAARNLRPQAALVDVVLPDGDGVSLAGELAALPWGPRIVLTSNDPGAVTEAVARSAGAAAFISKHDLPGSRLEALLTGQAQLE